MESYSIQLLLLSLLVFSAASTSVMSAAFEHSTPSYDFVRISVPSKNTHLRFRVRFSVFNKTWSLLLNRNEELLTTHFAVERRRSFDHSVPISGLKLDCYYIGTVDGERLSLAVFSTCQGLKGFLSTSREKLNIQPMYGNRVRENSDVERHVMHVVSRTFRAQQTYEVDVNGQDSDKYNSHDLPRSMLNFRRLQSSTSSTVYIETVVVADKTMLLRYGIRGLPAYILSAMNEVASLFRSKTISSDVRLVVSRLLILDDDQNGLNIVSDEEQILKSFCKWKTTLKPSLPSHDVTLLLTRTDMCTQRNATCRIRGLAFTAGMCHSHRACAVIWDDGLHLASTVAHEIGHTLGMLHDEDSGCPSRRYKRIMTSSTSVPSGAIGWSSCSDRSLTAFLRSEKAECLSNMPFGVDRFGIGPYSPLSRNKLCQEALGTTARTCELEFNGSCSGVWCKSSTSDHCTFFESRQLDGCPCDEQKVCMRGHCLLGAWSEWSGYGSCSTTCAQGVQHRERRCLGSSKGCYGNRRQYRLCNTRPCSIGSENARDVACASFNSKPHIDGNYYNWVSYFPQDPSMECQLVCQPDGQAFFALLAPFAPDGTVCAVNHQQDGICVAGKCQMVGCDGVVQSHTPTDRCGVCGGNGTSCRIVSSVFNNHDLSFGYHEVVRMPFGAINVHVKELAVHHNYLAVKSGLSNQYYVNGEFKLSQPGRFPAAGTTIRYSRNPAASESIQIRGPIEEPLVIMVLNQDRNAKVSYRYQVNKSPSVNDSFVKREKHRWRYTAWSNCSRSCAGGVRTRQLLCHDTSTKLDVQKTLCRRPPVRWESSRSCNVQPCSPKWSVGPWGSCTTHCGPDGVRRRIVQCLIQVTANRTRTVKRGLCGSKSRPASKEACNRDECSVAVWVEGQWKPCSVTCGIGWQSRDTLCRGGESGSVLRGHRCDNAYRPASFRICSLPDCPNGSETQLTRRCMDLKRDCAQSESSLCEWPVHRYLCCHTCEKLSSLPVSHVSGSAFPVRAAAR